MTTRSSRNEPDLIREMDQNITVASMRDSPRQDDGYFGPDSVTWKVMSHPAALNIGGGVAVMLQVLNPGEMRHLSHTTIVNEGER